MKDIDKKTVNRVLNNSSSKEDSIKVLEWFSDTPEGLSFLAKSIDEDLHLIDEVDNKEALISPVQTARILSKVKKQIRRKTNLNRFLKVAAILVPFVLILSAGLYINSQVDLFGTSKYAELYVPKGETMRLLFQDGSQVYLNSDTKISYPEKFGLKNRRIFLEGEAYFNVSSNKKRPFIVETDKANVTVLGTSFNVKAYDDDKFIDVVLDEGKILFGIDKHEYTVLPGQKISYDKENKLTSISNLEKSLKESIWREGIFSFTDTSLKDVIKTLNRKYAVNFVIENPKVLDYSYTLFSKQTAIEDILQELEMIAPVKFTITDEVVYVDL